MFQKGSKVYCVNDSAGWIDGATGLIAGNVYTIVDIIPNGDIVVDCGDYGAWDSTRFKLLSDEWVEKIFNSITETVKISQICEK